MMISTGLGQRKDLKVVVLTLYLHAVDQLSGKEQIQPHILSRGGKLDHSHETKLHC